MAELPFLFNLPAIDELDDVTETRVVLYQSGRLVHASLLQILDAVSGIDGEGLLLEGDAQGLGLDVLLLEGDAEGALILQ